MLEKLNNLEAAMRGPAFRVKAVKIAGGVVSFVATAVLANAVDKLVSAGVNAVVAKIEGSTTTETPAE